MLRPLHPHEVPRPSDLKFGGKPTWNCLWRSQAPLPTRRPPTQRHKRLFEFSSLGRLRPDSKKRENTTRVPAFSTILISMLRIPHLMLLLPGIFAGGVFLITPIRSAVVESGTDRMQGQFPVCQECYCDPASKGRARICNSPESTWVNVTIWDENNDQHTDTRLKTDSTACSHGNVTATPVSPKTWGDVHSGGCANLTLNC